MPLRKLYIAGPMTGYDELNYPAFTKAAKQLRDAGYEVVSPHELNPISTTWQDAMRVDLRALIDCEGVATLDGHEQSKGASLETYIARELGLHVQSLVAWLVYQNASTQDAASAEQGLPQGVESIFRVPLV